MHEREDSGFRLPASSSGRVPQWVLDELSGRPVPPAPWRQWAPPPPRRRRRLPGLRAVLLVALVVGLSLAAAQLPALRSQTGGVTSVEAATYPTPGIEASDEPLGTPAPAPATGGTHAFVALQDDGVTPVSYDPCRPIHYVIRPDNAPDGGDEVIRDAVARVSEVTGLVFVLDGPTDEASSDSRSLYQPERYGDRWAPVLVSWQTEEENADFLTDTVGGAGSAAVTIADKPKVFVSGVVDLDAAAFAGFLAAPDGGAFARAVVLHELGHLVGLDHVGDPTQLMYPETRDAVDFASGDLTGLARLGAGECVPQL